MEAKFSPFPVLTTERLVLRQMTQDDDKEVFFQRSDKEMNKYVDRPPATKIQDARDWIEKINTGIAANEWIFWGVRLKEGTDSLIGGFCFWNLSKAEASAEIGFGLHPEYWGQGLMQEALTEAIRFGFGTMQLQKILAYTHPDNQAAIKLLERNGFMLKTKAADNADGYYSVYSLSR